MKKRYTEMKKVSAISMPYVPKGVNLKEFKSEIDVKSLEVKFPKDLGEKHPFEFMQCETAYKKIGLVRAAVDKHLDFMISPGFYVTSKNKKAEAMINDFIQQENFHEVLRNWIKEALVKGNGFLELAIGKIEQKFKIVNANNMYVKRENTGEITEYNQFVGEMSKFNPKKVINFKPNQIAHLMIGHIGDDAYGTGMVMPGLYVVDNIIRSERDAHLLQSRKANSPIHAKLGSIEEPATQADVSAFGSKLEYLNNLHEWATDHRVEFKVLDFGNIGEKFTMLLDYDKEVLFYAFQVPAVIMGSGYQNEGIAKVQLDTFERRIQSLQAQVEKIVEEQIFNPYLELQGVKDEPNSEKLGEKFGDSVGLKAKVEMHWNLPSQDSINERILKLTTLLSNQSISPELKAAMENDIAKMLDYNEVIDKLPTPEEARAEKENNQKMQFGLAPGQEKPAEKKESKERTREEAITQPAIPGQRESVDHSWKWLHISEKESGEMLLKEWINIKEIPGLNYGELVQKILKATSVDEFADLKAVTEKQIEQGLLNKEQIEQLRKIMETAFKRNLSIKEIEDNIRNDIALKDRLDEADNLMQSAEVRPNLIARTETIRLANQGLVDMYGENGIQKVSWLAAVSDRTCEQCMNLDGQIFKLDELAVGQNQPPLHPNCRCTLLSVQE